MNGTASLAHQFAGQQTGPQTGMQQSGQLKQEAVAAFEEHRHHGRTRAAHNAGGNRVPGRVADLPMPQLQVGHLSGGKDHQHAAGFDPIDGTADGAQVGAQGSGAIERVDREGNGAQLGDPVEQGIGHHPDIRADGQQQIGQNDAVQAADAGSQGRIARRRAIGALLVQHLLVSRRRWPLFAFRGAGQRVRSHHLDRILWRNRCRVRWTCPVTRKRIATAFAACVSGICTAVIPGMSRAIGETMAVLMAAGGAAMIPGSIFDPVRPMPASIAVEMGEAPYRGQHYHALFATGMVLFVFTVCFNFIADHIANKYRQVSDATL
jgi:hypothetical protein